MFSFWLNGAGRRKSCCKNKKIYFTDPFIEQIFRKKYLLKEGITPEQIEAVVIANLLRNRSGYYWKNKKEVDLLLQEGKELLPMEIKYQNWISKSDYEGLYHFKRGFLLTKEFLSFGEKYSAIPVYLLLAVS